MKNSKIKSEICLKCQKCCLSIGALSVYPYIDGIIEFYQTRGIKVTEHNGLAMLDFPFPCQHLDSEKGCLIYDKRPKICKNFPSESSDFVEENCELFKQGLI